MDSGFSPWSPYDGRTSLTSKERVTLTAAFSDLIRFSAGFQPYELPEIFAAPEDDGENDAARDLVGLDANLLARKFVSGDITTYARPLNGGEVTAISPDHWEIDDPLPRFSTGAFNADDWANSDAPPTHRIFVDSQQFDQWFATLQAPGYLSTRQFEAIVDPQVRAKRSVASMQVAAAATTTPAEQQQRDPAEPPGVGPVLLKIDDVCEMVSQSRSTIYARMSEGRFPEVIKSGGSARWSKTEIFAWINEQAANRGN